MCGKFKKGQHIIMLQRVMTMKGFSEKAVKAIVAVAKKGVKDDINSTGSPWVFQPKLPKNAQQFKKSAK